jgi:hypothetical protein
MASDCLDPHTFVILRAILSNLLPRSIFSSYSPGKDAEPRYYLQHALGFQVHDVADAPVFAATKDEVFRP